MADSIVRQRAAAIAAARHRVRPEGLAAELRAPVVAEAEGFPTVAVVAAVVEPRTAAVVAGTTKNRIQEWMGLLRYAEQPFLR